MVSLIYSPFKRNISIFKIYGKIVRREGEWTYSGVDLVTHHNYDLHMN